MTVDKKYPMQFLAWRCFESGSCPDLLSCLALCLLAVLLDTSSPSSSKPPRKSLLPPAAWTRCFSCINTASPDEGYCLAQRGLLPFEFRR